MPCTAARLRTLRCWTHGAQTTTNEDRLGPKPFRRARRRSLPTPRVWRSGVGNTLRQPVRDRPRRLHTHTHTHTTRPLSAPSHSVHATRSLGGNRERQPTPLEAKRAKGIAKLPRSRPTLFSPKRRLPRRGFVNLAAAQKSDPEFFWDICNHRTANRTRQLGAARAAREGLGNAAALLPDAPRRSPLHPRVQLTETPSPCVAWPWGRRPRRPTPIGGTGSPDDRGAPKGGDTRANRGVPEAQSDGDATPPGESVPHGPSRSQSCALPGRRWPRTPPHALAVLRHARLVTSSAARARPRARRRFLPSHLCACPLRRAATVGRRRRSFACEPAAGFPGAARQLCKTRRVARLAE